MFFNGFGIHKDIIMIMNSSTFLWKIEFMKLVNVDGALPNPNGITKNSYKPYLVLIAIF
jgi:hypothetical protein